MRFLVALEFNPEHAMRLSGPEFEQIPVANLGRPKCLEHAQT